MVVGGGGGPETAICGHTEPPKKSQKLRIFRKNRVFGAKSVFGGLKACFGAQKRDLWPYGTPEHFAKITYFS